jgi:hypothetical protein
MWVFMKIGFSHVGSNADGSAEIIFEWGLEGGGVRKKMRGRRKCCP